MLGRSWGVLKQGPFSPLLSQERFYTKPCENPDDFHLARIYLLLKPDSSSADEEGEGKGEVFETCAEALEEVRRVFALPRALKRQAMVSVHVWPGTVSQRFIELVHERRTEALVILAHYCVLLKKVNSCWWLEGVGCRLLTAIERELGVEWRPWIEWALAYPV